jgi:O-acetyl-ADP-ribose deacetylase (regulator of RNase III)
MKIYFRDRNQALVDRAATNEDFLKAEVDIGIGSPLDTPVDAVVSPANSFGFMDGGIDYHFAENMPNIQNIVQDGIAACTEFNELLVGNALVVESTHKTIPYLVVAPTMRVPMRLPDASNVYLATRAAIREAVWQGIVSICFSGMGTGVGGISPENSIRAMGRGITDGLSANNKFKSWRTANLDHWDIIGKSSPLHSAIEQIKNRT